MLSNPIDKVGMVLVEVATTATNYMRSKRPSSLEYFATPILQRVSFNLSISRYLPLSEALSSSSVWQPLSTQRKRPPAEYCVNERRDSSSPTVVLEWASVAEGMSMVEPGGNSMARLRSQRTRWPPLVGSKSPRAVTAHQPKRRFWESRCMKDCTWGKV